MDVSRHENNEIAERFVTYGTKLTKLYTAFFVVTLVMEVTGLGCLV